MATLKDGVKSGTSEFDESGKQNSQGMVSALNELASFCDRELRLKEEEGESCLGDLYWRGSFMCCVCLCMC